MSEPFTSVPESLAASERDGRADSAAPATSDGARRVWRLVLLALILAKLAFLVHYAIHARWVMDEFSHGYISHSVERGLYGEFVPTKTVLPQLLFSRSLHRGLGSAEIHLRWRFETLAAALAVVLFTAATARRLDGSTELPSFTAVLALLSFSNFLESSISVRNDSFAVAFAAAAFFVAFGARRRRAAEWGSGLLIGLAFLCTQKTVYHLVALGVAHLLVGFGEGRWRGALVRAARYASAFSIPVLLYAVVLGGARAGGVLEAVFFSPIALSASLEHHTAGLGRFVVQTLARNPAAYALAGVGLATVLLRWRRFDGRTRAAAVASTLIVACVFGHQQPWPYVFVMAVPFLAVWVPTALAVLPGRGRSWQFVVLVAALSPSFVRNVQFLQESSALQFEIVRDAEALLAPDDRYFDGIGMVPTRHIAGRDPWWYWDGPTLAALQRRWAAGDRSELESILRDEPKVWIYTYRLRAMERLLAPTWRAATVRVSEHLLLSGCRVDPGQATEFRNLWSGAYRLYDRLGVPVDAPPIVDGATCPAPCRLEPKSFRVTAAGEQTLFLLPADFVAREPLPHEGPVRDIFARIYDF